MEYRSDIIRNGTSALPIETHAKITSAYISSTVNVIMRLGYYAGGDLGAAILKRVSTPSPVKAWHVQSADGAYWQLAEPTVNQYMFGAKDAWVQDDYSAFQAMADYCSQVGAAFAAAPGRHQTSLPIILKPKIIPDWNYAYTKRGPTWRFDNNCIIRATASIAAVIQLGDSTYESIIRGGHLIGGTFDCYNNATRGVWATFVNRVVIDNVRVTDLPASGTAIQVGTTTLNEFGTLVAGYEGMVQNCQVEGRMQYAAAARGSTNGISFINTTDNQTRENVTIELDTHIVADATSGYDGKHTNNHFWNYNAASAYGFDLYGDNMLTGNQQDGPFTYAGRFRAARNHVVGHKVNYGSIPADADNTAVLWLLDGAGEVCMTNSGIKGTALKRVKQEVDLTGGAVASQYTKDATNRYLNIVTYSPVNRGTAAYGHVTISGTTPTLQTNFNVTAVGRNAAGDYYVNFGQPVSANATVVVTGSLPGALQSIAAQEVKGSRSTTAARFVFVNASNAGVDVDAFNFMVTG